MARSIPACTWENGFREPVLEVPCLAEPDIDEEEDAYVTPPSKELVTSQKHNTLGLNVLRTWPTIYDGINSPHDLPPWWNPPSEVDVLICGAGPSGLEVGLSLARQGVSFRIIDRAEGPLVAGRADGVQPRFLEILNTWGLAKEVHEEGPIIDRTAVYKDGKKLLFSRSHQSDSRYRGLHVITQGQIERIFIRDLLRHNVLIERSTVLKDFENDRSKSHPIKAEIHNERSGHGEEIRAKFLVGSDGASSSIRKKLEIPFDGMSTDIYWGIMDCVFETDYPHAWVFGSVINSKHGGCVIIPREDGYIRLYTQLDVSLTGPIAASRQTHDPSLAESGGKIEAHSITPDEVLEQANKIFDPFKLRFASPLSWFAIWKISERVARTFSSTDLRVHLVGDAAHVHSVMGAFGLNASIMDASNLAWKMGLVVQEKAQFDILMPTYTLERRPQACRIIETSGEYLRFVCNTDLSIPNVREPEDTSEQHSQSLEIDCQRAIEISTENRDQDKDNTAGQEGDLKFLKEFFEKNGAFLLGVDAPLPSSVLGQAQKNDNKIASTRPIRVKNGVRAPNPRVCFSKEETGYMYDKMTGAATFHIVLFTSAFGGLVRHQLRAFSAALGKGGFYSCYGGKSRFNIILVTKCLPNELDKMMEGPELQNLKDIVCILYDDRAPDEDAHTVYGVNHRKGALVVVRPDLWIGMATFLDQVNDVATYFRGFLLSCPG